MLIEITYEVPTASGHWHRKVLGVDSCEEAEDICKRIDALKDEGYKLIDVTRTDGFRLDDDEE